ncbi:MAG: DNA-directed RNA polymerase subunit alpha [Phycisphaerales bacterium]|nr:DNA-directed RNA polymerase subunit alpha [Phycisphaerales bacterium]
MHIKWRGLNLPARVSSEARSLTPTFGRFLAEPFERGFGTTVGNGLRRILLSSLEGAAPTSVRISGVEHEFSVISGVLEDVTDLILNIKGLIVEMDGEDAKILNLSVQGPCDVTASSFEGDASVRIINGTHHIAKVTDKVKLEISITVERGRGYRPASEAYSGGQEQIVGQIPIDAIFSPVQRVRFRVEDTRIGQRTNYDKLVMDIWTNGTVTPELALVESAKILRKHLNPFVMYDSAGDEVANAGIAAEQDADADMERKLTMQVAFLDLGVRASNCLESAGVRTVAELIAYTEDELLALRAFGKTSLREVQGRLEELGLALATQSTSTQAKA